jgi:polysaccharide deacetylase 2 family uncharacterized protein YibQ
MQARASARVPIGIGWIVTWPLTIVLGAMIFLSAQEIHQQGAGGAPSVDAGGFGEPGWEDRLQERIGAVSAALERSSLDLQPAGQEPRGAGSLRWTHSLYDVAMSEKDRAKAEAEIASIQALDPGLTVTSEATFSGTEVDIGLDGLLTHTLRFRWVERPERPRVALVVGSLGDDLRIARRLVELEEPVALAVLPFHPFSKEVSSLGRMFEREVLVELVAAPPDDAGEAASVADARVDLDAALASVPGAIGVLHEPDGDPALAGGLRERGLFYVPVGNPGGESESAPALALDAATDGGFPAARVEALLSQALGAGSAIGVGRPSEATAGALEALVTRCQESNIDIVPISALAETVSLAEH